MFGCGLLETPPWRRRGENETLLLRLLIFETWGLCVARFHGINRLLPYKPPTWDAMAPAPLLRTDHRTNLRMAIRSVRRYLVGGRDFRALGIWPVVHEAYGVRGSLFGYFPRLCCSSSIRRKLRPTQVQCRVGLDLQAFMSTLFCCHRKRQHCGFGQRIPYSGPPSLSRNGMLCGGQYSLARVMC